MIVNGAPLCGEEGLETPASTTRQGIVKWNGMEWNGMEVTNGCRIATVPRRLVLYYVHFQFHFQFTDCYPMN